MEILAQETNRLSEDYLRGKFTAVTGGKPEANLWIKPDYRAGYLAGVAEYYDQTLIA